MREYLLQKEQEEMDRRQQEEERKRVEEEAALCAAEEARLQGELLARYESMSLLMLQPTGRTQYVQHCLHPPHSLTITPVTPK